MKLCIIKMPNKGSEALMPDLGIGMLVSALKSDGFEVSQADLKPSIRVLHPLHQIYHNIKVKEASNSLNGLTSNNVSQLAMMVIRLYGLKKYNILGFSLDVESNIFLNLSIIKSIKEQLGCTIVLGGTYNFTVRFMKECWFVDYVIKGDATEAFSKLMTELSKSNPLLSKVPGLIYREGDKVKSNSYYRQMGNTNMIPDFTALNMEDYHLSHREIMEKYGDGIGAAHANGIALLPFHFIKGCPNSCTFCFWNREKYYKHTDPEDVVSAIRHMKEKYKISNFIFLNNSFNPSLSYGKELLKSFISHDLNINWSDSINPNQCDPELITYCRDSGCRQLYWGIESASQSILQRLNRPTNSTNFETYLKRAHECNIFNGVNFFVGIPHESTSDISITADFIKRANRYFEYFNVNLLRLIPEYPHIRDPLDQGIKLLKLGSAEMRNPDSDKKIKSILNEAGISSRVKFYSFDEIDGLKWKEKNEQDIRHVKMLLESIDIPKKAFFENIHRVFYLSSALDSKDEIINLYKRLVKDG